MKNLFFFSVGLFSFLLISCGDKEKENLTQKIILDHDEYFILAKAAAKAEVEYELKAKAAKLEALELLISEGWRPKDCNSCDQQKTENKDVENKVYQKPKISYIPISELAHAKGAEMQNAPMPFMQQQVPFPFITNAPVFNNYCCGSIEKKETGLVSSLENFAKIDTVFNTDTIFKKIKPDLEIIAGYGGGPLGSLRLSNKKIDAGGLFLWMNKTKSADITADVVLKLESGIRYGAIYHTNISPSKWDIPSNETKTVSAGGVSTTITSTRKVEVEQWNVSKQALGPVLGYEKTFGKITAFADVIPTFDFYQKEKNSKKFSFNGRVGVSLDVGDSSIGLHSGYLDHCFHNGLSVKF